MKSVRVAFLTEIQVDLSLVLLFHMNHRKNVRMNRRTKLGSSYVEQTQSKTCKPLSENTPADDIQSIDFLVLKNSETTFLKVPEKCLHLDRSRHAQ